MHKHEDSNDFLNLVDAGIITFEPEDICIIDCDDRGLVKELAMRGVRVDFPSGYMFDKSVIRAMISSLANQYPFFDGIEGEDLKDMVMMSAGGFAKELYTGELARIALQSDGTVWSEIPDSVKTYELAKVAIRSWPSVLQDMEPEYRDDTYLRRLAAECEYIEDFPFCDKRTIIMGVSLSLDFFDKLPDQIKEYTEVSRAAIENSIMAIFQCGKKFIDYLFEYPQWFLDVLSKEFSSPRFQRHRARGGIGRKQDGSVYIKVISVGGEEVDYYNDRIMCGAKFNSKNQCADKDLAMLMIDLAPNGYELMKFAINRTILDREIIIALFRNTPIKDKKTYMVGTVEMKKILQDPEFQREFVEECDPEYLSHLDFKLLDPSLFLTIVKRKGTMLDNIPWKYQTKEMCLEACKNSGIALRHVLGVLAMDKDIVMTALRQNAVSYRYVHLMLRDDMDVQYYKVLDEILYTYNAEVKIKRITIRQTLYYGMGDLTFSK